MEEVLSDSVLVRRLSAWLLGVFAGLALMLAMVGIYGLTSCQVSQGTREFGLRMVVGNGISVALVGVAIGLLLALAVTRVMSGFLYGVTATGPIVFVGVALRY